MSRKTRKCPKCGKWTGAKGPYCPNCSAKLELSPIIIVEEEAGTIHLEDKEQEVTGKEESKSRNGFRVVAIVVLVAIILALVWWHPWNREAKNENSSNSNTISNIVSTDGKYTFHDGNGVEVVKDLSQAIGFVPDKNLLISDLKTGELGSDNSALTGNFDTYLNTSVSGFGPLAGYTDGTNDYNQYGDHTSSPQLPAYGWLIHTGEYVKMSGIGEIKGGPGRAALILIINRTDKVYRFPDHGVTVIAGFQGLGRIWNGESKEVVETEKRLTNHYLTRLGLGIPEKGFIGQTNQGAENATTVTVVTVERLQQGNNPDGTPCFQFRLIRAETVSAIK